MAPLLFVAGLFVMVGGGFLFYMTHGNPVAAIWALPFIAITLIGGLILWGLGGVINVLERIHAQGAARPPITPAQVSQAAQSNPHGEISQTD